jgi:hypothetical protein
MAHSSNQVELLIWPSKRKDRDRSVDAYGHVELLVCDRCYDFRFDPSENPTSDEIKSGCKGILLPRPSTAAAARYLARVMMKRGDDAVFDRAKHSDFPIVWSFVFDVSEQSMDALVNLLDSKVKDPPPYAAMPTKGKTWNCLTFALDSLSAANIFYEPSFDDPHPDALLDWLQENRRFYPNLVRVEELQLIPPGFRTRTS